MASVNFEKYKAAQHVKAMFRHCDLEKRLNTNHSNLDINKSATPDNMQGDLDYYAACQRYDERITYLDSKPGANKRKDRVTCFGLNTPAPKGLKPENEKAFFTEVLEIIKNQYGEDNIIQYYMHQDEKHEYINAETGERCMSRSHMQCYVVPEHSGKLNGKWFSNRSNMVKLNNSIHRMAQEQFGVTFMDGSKRKSRKTVEQLKNESTYLEIQKELEKQRADLNARQTAVYAQKAALDRKSGELQAEEQMLLKTQITLREKESDLDRREDGIKAKEDDSRAALQNAVELRNAALQVLLQLQKLENEDKQLIELGRQQRRGQLVSMLDTDDVFKAYQEINERINDLTPQM